MVACLGRYCRDVSGIFNRIFDSIQFASFNLCFLFVSDTMLVQID